MDLVLMWGEGDPKYPKFDLRHLSTAPWLFIVIGDLGKYNGPDRPEVANIDRSFNPKLTRGSSS